jgi:predicted permease
MPMSTLLALLARVCGCLLERANGLPARTKGFLAKLLLRCLYPALILGVLPERVDTAELLKLWPLPASMALLLLVGRTVGYRLLPFSGLTESGSQRSFVFLAILPNYSYLPLMIAQALWGQRGVALVALSSVGADLVLWTIGLRALQERQHKIVWRQLFNPPLLSLFAALALLHPGADALNGIYSPIQPWLAGLGSATIPVSMFLLGAHLARPIQVQSAERRAHLLLLGWRLVLAPALVLALVYPLVSHLPHPAALVLLIIASMPGAIMSVALSEHYHASPEFAAQHVLWGHMLWTISGSFWIALGFYLWAPP